MTYHNIVDISSNKYYDLIANSYHDISNYRSLYNKSIDEILIKYLSEINGLLDIGTGDGLRLFNIISKLDSPPNTLVCLEPALKLFNMAKFNLDQLDSIDFYNCDLESFSHERKFSHIIALWNVVGHVGDPLKFFQKTFDLLSPGGFFIFDVNNRFNIAQYGLKNVIINLLKEFRNSSDKGIFNLNSKISEELKVYLSSPFEVQRKLKSIGFDVVETLYVNYVNGLRVDSFINGQALFICKRP